MEYTLKMAKERLQMRARQMGVELNVPVYENSRMSTTYGWVKSERKADGSIIPIEIEFSTKLFQFGTLEAINDVIDHEFCHWYLATTTHVNHKHDAVFKALCAKIGCNGKSSGELELTDKMAYAKSFKYSLYCPHCGFLEGFTRSCKTVKYPNLYSCGACGSNKLYVEQNW